jgi:hypothetical protein
MTPTLLLESAVINRQWLHLGIWGLGLILNYAVNYTVLRSGYGISAIAWNDIWAQLVVVLLIYAAAHWYLFPDFASALRLYFPLLGLLLGCGCIYLILRRPLFSTIAGRTNAERLIAFVCRAAFVVAVWLPTAFFLHRQYPPGQATAESVPTVCKAG